MFRPAFKCVQHPKAGRNTQHTYSYLGKEWQFSMMSQGPFYCFFGAVIVKKYFYNSMTKDKS